MRDRITTALEAAGAVCVVAGVGLLLGVGAGLIVAGVALIAAGYLGAAE